MLPFGVPADHLSLESFEFGRISRSNGRVFRLFKRTFDIALSVLFLPVLAVFMAILTLLNPFFNSGRLFFVQKRMGQGCAAFRAIKFRTMRLSHLESRKADDPLEVERITELGKFLRRSRIDELPQILNVLRGEMSLIGPRPDFLEHARHYIQVVPGYRERHSVRPGISGLAQTEVGYVQSVDATHRKVRADLHYIQNAGFRLEAWIIWRTIFVVLKRAGS